MSDQQPFFPTPAPAASGDDPAAMLTAMVPPPGVERSRVFAALLRSLTEDAAPGRRS